MSSMKRWYGGSGITVMPKLSAMWVSISPASTRPRPGTRQLRCRGGACASARPPPSATAVGIHRPDWSPMRRILLALATALPVCCATALPASAAPLTVSPSANISIPSPFPPACGGPTEGSFPGTNFNYENSEVEPWLAVSPTNPNDVAGFWQQDRWSDGGAHGLVAAVSHNGGASFAYSWPHYSNCAGGTAANRGDYGRSSDPWVSWAPNGDLWSIALSVSATGPESAVLASRMRHGTSTWSEPFVLKSDTSRAGVPQGNNFNDKESITADRTDPSGNLVYAVWDRFVSPNENAPLEALLNAHAFHQPVWMARTTNGAADNPTWQTREIFDPGTQ